MYTPDEKTEELLSGYLDGCLTAIEIEQIESALVADSSLRDYFASMQLFQSQVRSELRSTSVARPKLTSAASLDHILTESRSRVESDPVYANASWVLGSENRTRNIAAEKALPEKADHRLVWTMFAVAASLLFVCGWWMQSRFGQELKTQQGLIARVEPQASSKSSIESEQDSSVALSNRNSDKLEETQDQGVSRMDERSESMSKGPSVPDSSIAKLDTSKKEETAKSSLRDSIASSTPATSKDVVNKMDSRSEVNKPGSDFVKPFVPPSAEELAALENSLKGATKLTYLLVIDLSLRDGEESREVLDTILTRYDIPSAVDMNVEESVLRKLEDSRMIANGKVVLPSLKSLPADKKSLVGDEAGSDRDTAGLVFVKARGERLDAAIIEMIQNVDEFPDFSLDMAFDAPAQALAAELRNIQEVSLPKNAPIARSSVASRLSVRDGSGNSTDRFLAPTRRGLPLPREKREAGKGPNGLTAEMMNPVSNALIILRNPK